MSTIKIYKRKSAGKDCLIKDEEGNVLIYTLLLLVLVTIIGISASRTATLDIQISGNHMNYKKNFYKAEGAALNAIQRMEDGDLESLTFISYTPAVLDEIYDPLTNWDTPFSDGTQAVASDIDTTHAKFVTYSEGTITTGESLDMTKTKIYQYKVFGRCEEHNGTSLIELGYRRVL